MLNPFPDLLTYSLLAPFILRLVVGFVFIDLGFFVLKSEKGRWLTSFKALRIPKEELGIKIFGYLQIISGLMLLVGFYTQIVALVLAVITFFETYIEYKEPVLLKRNFVFYLLLLAICLSLLFSGAGAFAIDLPL